MKFHPDVLRCHEQFGGDLEDMQRRYDAADALPASKEAEAVTDAMVERAWAAIVGEDIAATCFNANIVRSDLRAALSTAIPAGDGVPPGMARNALDCVVHALMVLPVPIDGQGKRAWASLLEAQTILEGLSTASTDGKG